MTPKLHKYVQRSLFYITNGRYFEYITRAYKSRILLPANMVQKKTKKFVKDKYFSNLAEI